MSLLTSLLIIIVTARLLGHAFQRYHQPAIVGEMIAGVLLGPSVFNVIQVNAALTGISEFAVFFVVLSAGLEMNFKDLVNALSGRGIVIAVLAFVIPLMSGIGVGLFYNLDVMRTVFVGLCISITALPVTVRILQSFNLLDSDIARYSVATAVFNDVTALLALGVILNLPAQPSYHEVVFSIFFTGSKLVLLGVFIVGFNWSLQKIVKNGVRLDALTEKLAILFGTEALFGVLILFVLVFGSVSEWLGFQFVIGAFFGALLVDRNFFLESRYNNIERTLSSIADGFLAPVFFAYLGLKFNFNSIQSIDFAVMVLFVSILSKISAGWLGARIIGLSPEKSIGIGIILNGRGVMELVVASIAFDRGFIEQGLFSTLVLMGVVTTMMTPILFRLLVMPSLPKINN
jgi:Kef-type K+ transport system membrane component KefB